MSNNTQKQGRTLYTERDYSFTPRDASAGWGETLDPSRVGDDWLRSMYRWERDLYEQLKVGDPIYDAAAKQRAMDYGNGSVSTATPATVAVTPNPTVNVVLAGGKLLTKISKATPSTVSVTSGALPAGTSLVVQGQNVVLAGTPTSAGAFTFSMTVLSDNGSVVVPVTGTIAA